MKIQKLLKYLKCIHCNNEKLLLNKSILICSKCSQSYRVIKGIPVMLMDKELSEQEQNQMNWYDNRYSKFSKDKYKLENWKLSMLNRLFNHDFKSEIKTYLDIGCGTSGYTIIEAVKKNNWITIGADISIKGLFNIKNYEEKYGLMEKVGLVVCSAENLPFKKNTFDYASAISLIEHIEDDNNVIKEICLVIAKNGYLYLTTPNTFFRIWPFFWPIYFYFDWKVGHKRHYSIERLDKTLIKNSFKRIKVIYNGHLTKIYQLLLQRYGLISDKKWWRIEKADMNNNSIALQLNAVYKKTKLGK